MEYDTAANCSLILEEDWKHLHEPQSRAAHPLKNYNCSKINVLEEAEIQVQLLSGKKLMII